MPTYQYRCVDCADELEVVQRFTDDALTECPSCEGGSLRKVFSAVGVVFKGSGFYATDNRTKGKANAAAPKTGAGESSSSPTPAAAAAPAPPKTAAAARNAPHKD